MYILKIFFSPNCFSWCQVWHILCPSGFIAFWPKWTSLRTWCIFTNTQLIGAYGTQWVPCSFEVWVCSRIIMSLIWDQFSKDTREKLPKKYSLHQENIFCQRGQVHFSIDRWHCNKSFYQWISPLKYYKIHKIELQSFCYHKIY